MNAGTAGGSDFSGAAEADGDLTVLDDHRNLPPAIGELSHALEAGFVCQDVDIVEGHFPPGEIRTGSRGIGSKILAVNSNVFRHGIAVGQSVSARFRRCHQVKRGRGKLQVWLGLC